MWDMAGSLSRGASEESQAKNHVAAFVAVKVQEIRRAYHVAHGGGVGAVQQVVHPAAYGEAIAMENEGALEMQVEVEVERVAVGIYVAHHQPALVPHGVRKQIG